MLCFCSLLYYKNLSEHVRRYKLEKKRIVTESKLKTDEHLYIKEFDGYLPDMHEYDEDKVANAKSLASFKVYNRALVNKWHVMVMLHRNRLLIPYRAQNRPKRHQTHNVLDVVVDKFKAIKLDHDERQANNAIVRI